MRAHSHAGTLRAPPALWDPISVSEEWSSGWLVRHFLWPLHAYEQQTGEGGGWGAWVRRRTLPETPADRLLPGEEGRLGLRPPLPWPSSWPPVHGADGPSAEPRLTPWHPRALTAPSPPPGTFRFLNWGSGDTGISQQDLGEDVTLHPVPPPAHPLLSAPQLPPLCRAGGRNPTRFTALHSPTDQR